MDFGLGILVLVWLGPSILCTAAKTMTVTCRMLKRPNQKTHLSASFIHAFCLLLRLGTGAVWVVSPRSPQSVIIRSTVPIIGEHNRHSTTAQQQHSSRANDNSSLQHRSQCLLPPLSSYTRQLNHNSHRNKLWEFWSKLQMFNESNFCCLLFLVQAPHYLFIDHQL